MKRLAILVILVMAVLVVFSAEPAQAQVGNTDPFYQEPAQDIDTTFHARVDYCLARGKNGQKCLTCGYSATDKTKTQCVGVEYRAKCQCTSKSDGGCKDEYGWCEWKVYG